MKMLQELHARSNNLGLFKIYYGEIHNEPISQWVSMIPYPPKFEVPNIDKFKSKKDPKEHLRYFKYSWYWISNDDALILLRIFSITLGGQEMN